MGVVELDIRDFAKWQTAGIKRVLATLGEDYRDGPTRRLLDLVECFMARGEHLRAYQFLMVFNCQSEPGPLSVDMLNDAFEDIPACDEVVEMYLACRRADAEAN